MKTGEPFPIPEAAERALDRRRFLATAAGAAVLLTAGEWLAGRVGAAISVPLEVAVPDADVLLPGEARSVVAANGREALVVRLAEGGIVAFDRRCPHLGCPVLWSAERHRFECPCHRAAFDAHTGGVLFGPPRRGLERATVRRA